MTRTTTIVKYDLFVVAFRPFNNPVPARIQDPTHIVRMYFAPGPCFLMNSKSDGSTVSGEPRMPTKMNQRDHGQKRGRFNKPTHTTGNKNNVILLKVFEDLSVGLVRKESRTRICHDRFSVVRKVGGHDLYGGKDGI